MSLSVMHHLLDDMAKLTTEHLGRGWTLPELTRYGNARSLKAAEWLRKDRA